MRDLCIPGLVGAYKSQSVAAQQWSQSVYQKEDRENEKYSQARGRRPRWAAAFEAYRANPEQLVPR